MSEVFKVTLRAARTNRGFTVKEVALEVGKSIETISKYESDATDIPHVLLITLLELYKTPYAHIFLGKESEFLGRRAIRHRTNSNKGGGILAAT